MSNSKVLGRFIWHELMTEDTDAAVAFYTKAIGWKTQQWPQNPDYTLFVTKGVPMAGLMMMPDEVKDMGVPPHWLSYIGTPDVDETAERAEALGGTVPKAPTDIPNVGRFAVISDPQGSTFAAFTPQHAPKGDMKPTLGDFSWHELVTTDWEAALDFYNGLFGWVKTDSMNMGPEMGTYQMYGWKGLTLGGMFNKPASMPAPPHWMPYAMVTDSKKVAQTVKQLGGQILNGPMEVPGGDWVVQCMDPQGVAFSAHSVTAATKPAATKPAAKAKSAKPRPKKRVAAKRGAKPRPKKRAAAKKVAKRAKKRGAKRATKPRPKKRAAARKAAKRAKKRVVKRRPAARRAPKRKAKKK